MARKFHDLEIRNASKLLRIDVSAKDIDRGKPLDPTACAAAQAVLRQTKADECYIHRGVCYLKIGKVWHKYTTSSGLRMETIIFDRGGKFMSGEYDLKPVSVSALIARTKRSPSKGRSPKEAALATRRRVIPGVRRSARTTEEDSEDGNS